MGKLGARQQAVGKLSARQQAVGKLSARQEAVGKLNSYVDAAFLFFEHFRNLQGEQGARVRESQL